MQYDCIVVGSGSVGCVTAPRLSDTTDKSVILLEAGPDYRTPSAEPDRARQHLFSDPYDRRRIRQAIRKALEIADKSPFRDFIVARLNPTDADLVSDDALDNWILRNAYTQHHIAGTCKMGPATDATAVVNRHGQVHGVEGPHVADASIMPNVIRANTNAATIMISERVAEFIKAGI